MPYVVWIAEDGAGYFAQCRSGRRRPHRARERARGVWSKRFEGQSAALSFFGVAAVAEELTRRREAARLTALLLRRTVTG